MMAPVVPGRNSAPALSWETTMHLENKHTDKKVR